LAHRLRTATSLREMRSEETEKWGKVVTKPTSSSRSRGGKSTKEKKLPSLLTKGGNERVHWEGGSQVQKNDPKMVTR